MNKFLVIDYRRLNFFSSMTLLMKGPYLFILSLFLYDVNCSIDSLQATILIFYLFFFTLIFFLFVKFIFYFEEFRIDKFVLSLVNILFLVYCITQLLVLINILKNLYNKTEKCEKLNILEYLGVLILLMINSFLIKISIEVYKKKFRNNLKLKK